MHVGYVVLYVTDVEACVKFWVQQVGMGERSRTEVAGSAVVRVGFGQQNFSFELVPLEFMKENPNNLNLGAPSICFYSENLESDHENLKSNSVQVTEIADHFGKLSFAFSDNEGRWFAVAKS